MGLPGLLCGICWKATDCTAGRDPGDFPDGLPDVAAEEAESDAPVTGASLGLPPQALHPLVEWAGTSPFPARASL